LAITGSLIFLLSSSKTAFKRTNDLLNTLMAYAVNRSLFTCVLTFAGLIVFFAAKGSLWFMALEYVVTAVHANSLMGAMNTREVLRARAQGDVETVATAGSQRPWRSLLSSGTRAPSSRPNGSAWSQEVSNV
jgi:hypothetical protein